MKTKTFEAVVESAWGDDTLTAALKEKFPTGLKYSGSYDAPETVDEVRAALGSKYDKFVVKAGEARVKASAKQTAMAAALTAAGFTKPEAATLSPFEIAVNGLVKGGVPKDIAEATVSGLNLSKERPAKE